MIAGRAFRNHLLLQGCESKDCHYRITLYREWKKVQDKKKHSDCMLHILCNLFTLCDQRLSTIHVSYVISLFQDLSGFRRPFNDESSFFRPIWLNRATLGCLPRGLPMGRLPSSPVILCGPGPYGVSVHPSEFHRIRCDHENE